MNAEEVRQYAKELQEENKEARALGPLNKWLIRWCIRKIDKEIKRATRRGRDYYTVVFTVNALNALQDNDKLYLRDYYKTQGYHVALHSSLMDISWEDERPRWFPEEKPWKDN